QPWPDRAGPTATAPAARACGNRADSHLRPQRHHGAFGNDRRSVLELADDCDVPTRWSCRTGVCHTCITPLLSGDITYSPAPLETPADGEVLICCARPRGEIVLDM